MRALREACRAWWSGRRHSASSCGSPRRALAELGAAADALGEIGRLAFAGVPSTPFNGHVSTLRRVVWTTFSLNETKAIKNRLGGTVNDVVLATISAALRGYLECPV
jgi:hypothetical protein